MSTLEESVSEILSLPEEKKRQLAKIAIEHLKERFARERRKEKKSVRRAK